VVEQRHPEALVAAVPQLMLLEGQALQDKDMRVEILLVGQIIIPVVVVEVLAQLVKPLQTVMQKAALAV
jgi:hypothetical protein